jgi:dTDP-4-amino-4,6-dideoxygalactose transaminase
MQNSLESYLIHLTKKKYCFFLSRGATALYLIFKALIHLAPKKKSNSKYIYNKIIIPATLCHSPANVAMISGLKPIFCDVNLNNYTICPIDLRKKLESNEGVIAVLVAGTFGHLPNMKEIENICEEFGAYLIDDSAQSIGSLVENRFMGSWGDVGIYSFGHTKTIDVGGGAVLLTDNIEIYKFCKQLYTTLPYKNSQIVDLQKDYSLLYYEIENRTKIDEIYNKLFWNFSEIFAKIYCYRVNDYNEIQKKVLNQLDNLDEIIHLRQENWNFYKKRLERIDVINLPENNSTFVPWRFTFRISSSKRNSLVEFLRSENINASTWYPSLENRYQNNYPFDEIKCPNSNRLTDEIVNLWVDPRIVDFQIINLTCNQIENFLKQ